MNRLLMLSVLLPCLLFAQDEPIEQNLPEIAVIETSVEPEWSNYMGKWKPTQAGECTQEQHDDYNVEVDGLLYPTWHPPSEPDTLFGLRKGCSYGHEHGFDPSTFKGRNKVVAFGYVNQQYAAIDTHGHRHEDHVGHKVFINNAKVFKSPGQPDKVCAIMGKMHQGTHSADAFTNNLHEQMYRGECEDGTYFEVQLLSAIGVPGQFLELCPTRDPLNPTLAAKQRYIKVGPPVPEDSPKVPNPYNQGGSLGDRVITTDNCLIGVAKPLTATNYFELWRTQNTINSPIPRMGGNPPRVLDKNTAAFKFAAYYSTSNASRYYNTKTLKMEHTLDTCWQQTLTATFLVINNPCLALRKVSDGYPFDYTDSRSPFKGDIRGLRTTNIIWSNANGPEVWYTDGLGQNAALTPNPDLGVTVVQRMSKTTTPLYTGTTDPIEFKNTDPRVHAPN